MTVEQEGLHAMWASVAGAWERHADYVDARGAAVTARMLALTAPRPGERVLELACGPGSVGRAAAPLVAPDGEVVVSDVVPEMTAIAAARARTDGLANVTARVLDVEAVDEPDASYDVVLCREGLMLVADPARGAAEIARILRQGGRVAIAVWGPRARNPWLGIVFDAVGEQLGIPVPPPGLPHPFALDDAERLAALLADAGLADVAVDEVDVPYEAASFDDWWERTLALAGPLAQRVAALPSPAVAALRERAAARVAGYRSATGLCIPGVSLVASASAAP